jgi:hypothetical protein
MVIILSICPLKVIYSLVVAPGRRVLRDISASCMSSTNSTTRAMLTNKSLPNVLQTVIKKMEAGVGIEPAYTALQAAA